MSATEIGKLKSYLDQGGRAMVLEAGMAISPQAPFATGLVLYHLPVTAAEQGSAPSKSVGAMTFSIVARSSDGESWGVAVAGCPPWAHSGRIFLSSSNWPRPPKPASRPASTPCVA